MKTNLNDKVVIVTGASRGIGVSIVERLAKHGAHLILAARNLEQLESLAKKITDAGGKAVAVRCDVTVPDDRDALIAAAREHGPIRVLINNAGIEIPVAVNDQHPEDIDRQIAINLIAPLRLTRAVLPEMIEQNSGCVVMVSSMSGKSPTPYNAIYSATKYGLNGFTMSLRIELEATDINVGVVCPSFVADAGMWADTGVKAPAMLREVPLSRVVDGVEQIIDGAAEVLVTPTPVRPLLALGQLFPSIDAFALRTMGVTDVLHKRALATAKERSKG
ncbi:MAG: SDR family oxidoreductase [Myxococcota bacterium]